MRALVFVEHHRDELSKGSLGVLTKAADLDREVAAVIVGGPEVKALASEVGGFGATTVYVAEDESFDPPLPQPRVDVLAKVVRDGGYDAVLFSNSVLAADIAGGLAARLDAGLNWDLVDILDSGDDLIGKRPANMAHPDDAGQDGHQQPDVGRRSIGLEPLIDRDEAHQAHEEPEEPPACQHQGGAGDEQEQRCFVQSHAVFLLR